MSPGSRDQAPPWLLHRTLFPGPKLLHLCPHVHRLYPLLPCAPVASRCEGWIPPAPNLHWPSAWGCWALLKQLRVVLEP